MMNLKTLPNAIKFALFVGTASMVAGPAFAQDQEEEAAPQTEEATTLDRIQVTGSRLKRADIEGALPVTVMSREEIDASGDMSVADALRDATFAATGNLRPQSGSSAQSVATINLGGLGADRTLVLIDGHRLPRAATLDGVQNLNTIPLAAVERIEILSGGASAVYGSDAIGGVVNIILRTDFEGAQFTYGIGKTEVTGGDTEEYSVLFGAAGERGRIIAGVSGNSRDSIYTRDQIGYVQGISSFGNNYRLVEFDGDEPVAFAGPFTAVPGFACDSDGFFLSNGLCSYDFNAVAANAASSSNRGLFARGDFQINDDWSAYFTAMGTKSESFGRYAPVPAGVFVRPDTAADPIKGDGFGALIRHRFAALGPRDNNVSDNLLDALVGMRGRIADAVDVDFGIRRTRTETINVGTGYTVNPFLQEALENGSYDLQDPFSVDPEVAAGLQSTIVRKATYDVDELFINSNFDLFEMGGGTSAMAIGAEHREERYADIYDSLSSAGLIDGSAGNSAAGERSVTSAYAEWLFPITSQFEATLAGRYDKYSDYGNDFSPKLSLRYQPLDNLTLRGSYGEGFRAPPLSLLTQKESFSAESVIDPATCVAFGGDADDCQINAVQVDTYFIANPGLASEQSATWNLGVAYDPTDWMNVTLDYYNTEIEDRIRQFSAQTLIDRTNNPALGPIPPGLGVERGADGSIIRVTGGFGNGGLVKTERWNMNVRTDFDFGDMGELNSHLQAGYFGVYTIDDGDNLAGTLGLPEWRVNLIHTWSLGDWDIGAASRFIGNNEDPGYVVEGDFVDPPRVGGYTIHDVSVTWNSPWNADVSVGVNNAFDKYPEVVGYDGRPWNFNLYDAYGRTVYFRYQQSF